MRIAAVAQIVLVVGELTSIVLENTVGVTPVIETVMYVLAAFIIGSEIVAWSLCGGHRVISWITSGFTKLWGMALIPVLIPAFLVVAVLWTFCAMALVTLVPILPVYLTYRECY